MSLLFGVVIGIIALLGGLAGAQPGPWLEAHTDAIIIGLALTLSTDAVITHLRKLRPDG